MAFKKGGMAENADGRLGWGLCEEGEGDVLVVVAWRRGRGRGQRSRCGHWSGRRGPEMKEVLCGEEWRRGRSEENIGVKS